MGKVLLLKEIDGQKFAGLIRNVEFLKMAAGRLYYASEELEQENS